MEKPIEGSETLSDESREVLEELKKEGLEIDEQLEKLEESEESEETNDEEKSQEKSLHEEDRKERKSREPEMIPLWKAEIEKKRLQKEWEEKMVKEKEQLFAELKNIKSEIENLKSTSTKKEDIESQLSALAEEYSIEEGFVKKLFNLIPKPKEELSVEVREKLSEIDKFKEESRKKEEDREFENSFNSKVIPKLKEFSPAIAPEEIAKIKNQMKSDYFSERYISLDIDEIYAIKADKYKEFISPQNKSVEKGVKGVSRDNIIDYSNITEEQYAQMSFEEQEKVNSFLRSRK